MLRQILHWLGLLGLVWQSESDEPRIPEQARKWGEARDGLALGVAVEGTDVSMALRNVSDADRALLIPEWTAFYQIRADAPVTRYAELLRKAAASKPQQKLIIKPGRYVETDLPIDRLLQLQNGRMYRVQVSCTLGLTAPEVEITYENQ